MWTTLMDWIRYFDVEIVAAQPLWDNYDVKEAANAVAAYLGRAICGLTRSGPVIIPTLGAPPSYLTVLKC